MSALAHLLSAAIRMDGSPHIAPAPQSMHGAQGMGPSASPIATARLAPLAGPVDAPMPGGAPTLPGVAAKRPAPPPRGGRGDGKPVPLKPAKHADVESEAEDKFEAPGEEEAEDEGGMMGAAKKALKKGKEAPKKGKK